MSDSFDGPPGLPPPIPGDSGWNDDDGLRTATRVGAIGTLVPALRADGSRRAARALAVLQQHAAYRRHRRADRVRAPGHRSSAVWRPASTSSCWGRCWPCERETKPARDQAIVNALSTGCIVIILPVLTVLSLFINAGITHVMLLLLNGARHGFETTMRVAAYAHGSAALLNLIPLVRRPNRIHLGVGARHHRHRTGTRNPDGEGGGSRAHSRGRVLRAGTGVLCGHRRARRRRSHGGYEPPVTVQFEALGPGDVDHERLWGAVGLACLALGGLWAASGGTRSSRVRVQSADGDSVPDVRGEPCRARARTRPSAGGVPAASTRRRWHGCRCGVRAMGAGFVGSSTPTARALVGP